MTSAHNIHNIWRHLHVSHTYTHEHTHVHAHTCVHAHTRMHAYTLCAHMHLFTQTHTRACTQSPTGAATRLQLGRKPLIKGKSHFKKDEASFCAAVRQLILLILEKL